MKDFIRRLFGFDKEIERAERRGWEQGRAAQMKDVDRAAYDRGWNAGNNITEQRVADAKAEGKADGYCQGYEKATAELAEKEDAKPKAILRPTRTKSGRYGWEIRDEDSTFLGGSPAGKFKTLDEANERIDRLLGMKLVGT